MADSGTPYSRSEYNRALILNSVFSTPNVLLLAGMLIAGILLGVFAYVLPVALVVYGIAAARTYFDEDEAKEVLARERDQRRRRLEAGRQRIDPESLAGPIRALVYSARAKQEAVEQAISRAELPYVEVGEEVERFVDAMEGTAGRAQLLYEALEDSPPQLTEQRLNQLRRENDPGRAELVSALTQQLAVQKRMGEQLQRFYDQMERILVELDTVRGNLVSVSASTDSAQQTELAADVRGLRDELGALSEGMSVAFEEQKAVPDA